MGRARMACALVLAAVSFASPVAAEARYEPDGAYLDYAKRPSPLDGFAGSFATYEIAPGGRGLVEVWPDGARYFASVQDGVYGLWWFTDYVRTGRTSSLDQAKRAARWLRRKQDPDSGIYPVGYSYDIGGRPDGSDHIVLEPPWFGSNVQAIPISLLTRLYRATGKGRYLREARLALRPLTRPKGEGGVLAHFLDTGETFFEGYATLPMDVHTLSHHVQTLLALFDMRELSRRAHRLFRRGMRALAVALPYYHLPDEGRSAAWLAHLTDPPRAVSVLNGYYQESMVEELGALDSVAPDPVVRTYRAAWEAQLPAICSNPAENCFFH